jgi:hypothetical protein
MANKLAVRENSTAVAAYDDEFERELTEPRAIDNLPREAFAIPFLKLLQPLSPEVSKKMDGYVEGAKPGMFYNTVSGRLHEGNVTVVPAYTEVNWVEWVPKDKGGGLVAVYPPGHVRILEAKNVEGKLWLPNDNILEETHQHYCVMVDPADGSLDGVLLNMKGTQRRESRRWNSQIRTAQVEHKGQLHAAKPWHYAYILGSVEAANEKGSWFKWEVKGRGRSTVEQMRAARDFARAVQGGERKADLAAEDIHEEIGTPAQRTTFTQEAVPGDVPDLDDNTLPY